MKEYLLLFSPKLTKKPYFVDIKPPVIMLLNPIPYNNQTQDVDLS